MSLNEDMLIKPEDMVNNKKYENKEDKKNENLKKDLELLRGGRVGVYREKLEPFIPEFRGLIEKGSGEAVIKLRRIMEILGYEEYKNKNENTIYTRVKAILLEHGIKTVMYHHFGCNFVLSIADESEILSDLEANRINNYRAARKAGFLNWGEYQKNKSFYKNSHSMNMDDIDSKFYFINVGKKYIIELFPGAIINKKSLHNQYFDREVGGYDWTVGGVKIKHIASGLRHKIEKDGYERDFFEWLINKNDRADIFVLTGWDKDRRKLKLLKGWIIDAKEIVNENKFWNRITFLISTHKRSIKKYSQYEIGEDKLDLVRKKIGNKENITVEFDDSDFDRDYYDYERGKDYDVIKIENENWYSDIFRTVNWG